MANPTNPTFNGLTFAVVPVMTSAGALNNAGLPAGTVIAGILDPTMTQRIFNPLTEGNNVQTSDAYTKWLPVVAASNGLTAAQVVDNLNGGVTRIGQVTLELTPAAANVVEAPSVMTFRLSPQALIITATAGTF